MPTATVHPSGTLASVPIAATPRTSGRPGPDERNAPWSLFAAGAVIAAIPIVALFMYLQKYIVAGLTSGSVKG